MVKSIPWEKLSDLDKKDSSPRTASSISCSSEKNLIMKANFDFASFFEKTR
jgi:hypothetical protein